MGQINIFGEEEHTVNLTYEEKIDQARDALKLAAEISKKYYNEPLIVSISGGKDSSVLLDLAINSLRNDEFIVLNAHTTVDAPETVKHIEKEFAKCNELGIKTSYHNRYPVKVTMWDLIVEKKFCPTRIIRYCCDVLKESSTPNRICALGVREDESTKRRGRDIFR